MDLQRHNLALAAACAETQRGVRGMGQDGERGVYFTRPDENKLAHFLKGSIEYA